MVSLKKRYAPIYHIRTTMKKRSRLYSVPKHIPDYGRRKDFVYILPTVIKWLLWEFVFVVFLRP